MQFTTAYDPFRALASSWTLVKRTPAAILVGGVLLTLFGSDGGGSGGGNAGVQWKEEGRLEALEAFVILLLVGLAFFVGLLLWLFVSLIKVGMAAAVERSLRGEADEVGVLFQSRGRWPSMLLATFVQALLTFAAMVPIAVIVAVTALFAGGFSEVRGPALAVGVLAALLYLPVPIYVALGLALTPKAVAVEGLPGLEAIGRSWELARGNRLWLLLYFVVLAVFTALGLLACCVGVLFTGALSETASYESYLRLVRPDEEQAAWDSAA